MQPGAVAVAQCCPCLLLHCALGSHVPEQWPLGSSMLAAESQTKFGWHRRQTPGQSLSTQQPTLGMHVPLHDFVPVPQP